ncbi:MAG TPA: polymer-forming cytoskeletal protein [Polyangiales bacterium]|nr:polymer-forming cytoskeletal protein [Polyangiales bacterium]
MSKPDAANKQTTVEEGTQFKGTLHSNCQVLVRGVVEGDLTAPSVIVSDSGTVVGNVKAQIIRSEGVLAGRVEADEVQLSGNVRSDTVIRAKTLEIKLQRTREKLEVTFGECILDVGEDPGAEAGEPVPASTGGKGKRAQAQASADKSDDSEENSNSNHRSQIPPS